MRTLKEDLIANRIRYIAIEGSIGAGKTTLARLIAKETEARLYLEEVDDNPFIERFYNDVAGYAFQTQIFFLLSRYRQQMDITQQDLFSDLIVADYIFAKDAIYAHAVLGDDELALYNRIRSILEGRIVRPDIVVYLQASPEVLLHRIRKRGRSFEKQISEDYLASLNEAFNHFFFHYTESPLLIVNTDNIDFRTNVEHIDDLLAKLSEGFEGTRYYVPSLENE
jgi:deoxyguanosine kinase